MGRRMIGQVANCYWLTLVRLAAFEVNIGFFCWIVHLFHHSMGVHIFFNSVLFSHIYFSLLPLSVGFSFNFLRNKLYSNRQFAV